MIECKECIRNLHPHDPRVPVGRYHQSTCGYYCDKPSYYRELEQALTPDEKSPEPQWAQEQWRYVQQLRGMVLHLDKQVKEALSKKKKPEGKFS